MFLRDFIGQYAYASAIVDKNGRRIGPSVQAWPKRLLVLSLAFDCERNAHAAANAQSRQTLVRIAALHFEEKC